MFCCFILKVLKLSKPESQRRHGHRQNELSVSSEVLLKVKIVSQGYADKKVAQVKSS